jgi:transcriptional regulator with XRE-family HTH domain
MNVPDTWRAWLHSYGAEVRRLREFVGLSQERLAHAAGVSQGAVSRLERGRALATPLLSVLKIQAALSAALRTIDPAILSDDLRAMIEREHVVAFDIRCYGTSLTNDTQVAELVTLFQRLPETRREKALAVIRTVTEVLATEAEEVSPHA